MRTFIIKARKGTTRWDKVRSQVGAKEHFEVIAHVVMNAFFISNDFRKDVEVHIVLDSSENFPHTIKLSAADGLSLAGFHEDAILRTIELALKNAIGLQKNETRVVAKGIELNGFGFEKLVGMLQETRPIYLLERKGEDIRSIKFAENPVFILSDHLSMPKKSLAGLKRHGLKTISVGRKMLFASQCVVLIHNELDR